MDMGGGQPVHWLVHGGISATVVYDSSRVLFAEIYPAREDSLQAARACRRTGIPGDNGVRQTPLMKLRQVRCGPHGPDKCGEPEGGADICEK